MLPIMMGQPRKSMATYVKSKQKIGSTPLNPKYSHYQLPNGENYREVVLTMSKNGFDEASKKLFGKDRNEEKYIQSVQRGRPRLAKNYSKKCYNFKFFAGTTEVRKLKLWRLISCKPEGFRRILHMVDPHNPASINNSSSWKRFKVRPPCLSFWCAKNYSILL